MTHTTHVEADDYGYYYSVCDCHEWCSLSQVTREKAAALRCGVEETQIEGRQRVAAFLARRRAECLRVVTDDKSARRLEGSHYVARQQNLAEATDAGERPAPALVEELAAAATCSG
jgi:hypothetical protein